MYDLYFILIFALLVLCYFRYFGPLFIKYKLDEGAYAPTKAYSRAACFDLYVSDKCETKVIPPGQWRPIITGVYFAPAPHFYFPKLGLTITPFGNIAGKIHSRSGLALKRGIRGHLGIMDNDWRGEWSVILHNHSNIPYRIKHGDKIGQIEFFRVPHVKLIKSNKLSKSRRGLNGFGSSDVNVQDNRSF